MSAGLRAGYKQTEVGVIPMDWEVRRLSEHFNIYAGGDVPKHSLSQTKSESHPYPIFANALQNKGLYGYTNERRSKADSLTITARGYLGHAEYRDQPFFPIVRLLVLEPSRELDARFTTYAVNDRIEFPIESTGVPQLTAPQVGKYSVASPPTLPEQRAIASALSDVDALLGGLHRLIAKKRDLKQAAMQQLLTGQTRLPGFSGEWERTELKRLVLTPITDGPHMTPKFYDSGVPFLSVNNLADNQIDLTGLRYISKEDDKIFSIKCKPRVGDVLLGKAASVGKVALVEEDFDFNIWSPIALVRAGDQINAKFLYYQLLSADCIGQIALLTNSSSQGNIGMGDIEKLQISFPSLPEQTAIATILSDMDTELAALQTRRSKTQSLKQAMMQELLTGRIRLV